MIIKYDEIQLNLILKKLSTAKIHLNINSTRFFKVFQNLHKIRFNHFTNFYK